MGEARREMVNKSFQSLKYGSQDVGILSRVVLKNKQKIKKIKKKNRLSVNLVYGR